MQSPHSGTTPPSRLPSFSRACPSEARAPVISSTLRSPADDWSSFQPIRSRESPSLSECCHGRRFRVSTEVPDCKHHLHQFFLHHHSQSLQSFILHSHHQYTILIHVSKNLLLHSVFSTAIAASHFFDSFPRTAGPSPFSPSRKPPSLTVCLPRSFPPGTFDSYGKRAFT